jgi:hypothetical protein
MSDLAKKYNRQELEEKYPTTRGRVLDLKECRKKYNSYRTSAERRRIEFNLTYLECIKLFRDKCYYCGLSPRYNGQTQLSGIDRKDSSGNYEMINVVSCCTTCNMAKGTLSPQDYITLACRVALNHPKL